MRHHPIQPLKSSDNFMELLLRDEHLVIRLRYFNDVMDTNYRVWYRHGTEFTERQTIYPIFDALQDIIIDIGRV